MTATDPATNQPAGRRTAGPSRPPAGLGADLGLTDEDLLGMYRMVALARAVDERMWILNRAGRIPFVISGQGHEGAQVGVTWAFQKGHDWIAPFYRSIAMCLTFGMTARDIMLAQYAKASDPSSGGRQMPGHYGDRRHNLLSVSSPVATQILHAVGIALAAKIRGTGQVALAAMGEGSSNQGDVHEALNFAAIHKLPFVFLVENNGYAISVPAAMQVSVPDVAMRAAGYGIPGCRRRRLRRAGLLRRRQDGRRAGPGRRGTDPHRGQGDPADRPLVGRPADEVPDRGGSRRREGPRRPAPLPRPAPGRRDPDRGDRVEPGRGADGGRPRRDGVRRGGAGPGAVDRDALGLRRGLAIGGPAALGLRRREPRLMALMTFIEAIRDTLAEEMRRDETVIVLGEDVGKKGGVFLATDGLWAEFGDHRVIDTPLTESMIVGASIGAAVNGLRPVAEIQFADFIHPAFNQLVSEAARMRYRSNNAVGLPMTIRAPYGGGVHGALYHSQSVEAFFTHVPGLKVVVPSTPHDARGLLRSSIRDDDPVLFFEHKKMYRSVRGDVPDGDFVVPLGRARVTHPGSQVTVIAYGLMAHYALEAADRVAEEGISVEVVDLRTLRPLDKDTVLTSVRKTGKCLIVYEDNRFGGYGAEVAAIVAEEAFDYLDGPVTRIAGPDVPGVPYNHVLEDWFMVDPEKIVAGIRKLAAY